MCVRATIVVVEKLQVLLTLCVCLQPLVSSVQCACAVLSPVAYLALEYFSTLPHKQHGLKKIIEHKLCLDLHTRVYIYIYILYIHIYIYIYIYIYIL